MAHAPVETLSATDPSFGATDRNTPFYRTCELVVSFIQVLREANYTQKEAGAMVSNICEPLPQSSVLECDALVSSLLLPIMEYLVLDLTHQPMCAKVTNPC